MDISESSGSYSTSIIRAAASAVSSSTAATAATGSPTKRTFSTQSGSSSWLTGMIPNRTGGKSRPVMTAYTPGSAAARVVSIRRMRACGCCARRSFAYAMRGRARSSAKRVSPVTFAHASTFGRRCPMTDRGRSGGCSSVGSRTPRPTVRSAASSTASRIFVYPVQRQRFPASAARIASRSGRGVAVEQGPGGQQDPGRAVSALRGPQLREGLLERVEPAPVREPLHGQDRRVLALDREREAREDRLAVRRARCRSRTRPARSRASSRAARGPRAAPRGACGGPGRRPRGAPRSRSGS